jgi:hypothetical protein
MRRQYFLEARHGPGAVAVDTKASVQHGRAEHGRERMGQPLPE